MDHANCVEKNWRENFKSSESSFFNVRACASFWLFLLPLQGFFDKSFLKLLKVSVLRFVFSKWYQKMNYKHVKNHLKGQEKYNSTCLCRTHLVFLNTKSGLNTIHKNMRPILI